MKSLSDYWWMYVRGSLIKLHCGYHAVRYSTFVHKPLMRLRSLYRKLRTKG
jgi:hypothetical protein